ncbi:hypothetical protein HMPREF1624_02546 [Sporothrix schenckii ATCC 58251]|uniref:FAD-binding domain-containing protein n=1 Tax=Sporothrix schenckii (strain ATCC 58251 / de Perez 2211183) TaxID=1391915 RepID=U7Q0B5_SPOS1|nr:hypothetical protein HMPREF1624_02546 [Sporothrix schenckii ATCC 58251]
MTWKVAIIGGGPGGLAAAIALTQLNEKQYRQGLPALVEWTLYEKKPRISETGGGISIQRHTWRMLELLGVADRVDARDVFRAADGRNVEHRNAVTGVLIARRFHSDDTPPHQVSGRMVRAKLQKALLSAVDASRVRTDKKLVSVEDASDTAHAPAVRLAFADGEVSSFDLVIGADGIRSVVRSFLSPHHTLQYNGQSAYRTILRKQDVAAISGIPASPVFWQYVGGKYVFTCPLGGDDFEVTARIRPDLSDDEAAQQTSWGQPYDMNRLLPSYAEFAPPLRQILRLAADVGGTQEFAMFHGPRLETVVKPVGTKTTAAHGGGVLLLGDASHPLSGAFGAGAGFAFEDAFTLARALSWAHATDRALADALWVYDHSRSPHYANLYKELDRGGAIIKDVASQKLPLHDEISERVRRLWLDDGKGGSGWVYLYHADEVVEEVIQQREKELATTAESAKTNETDDATPENAAEPATATESSKTKETSEATPKTAAEPVTNGQPEQQQPSSVKDVVVPVVQEVTAAAA